MKTMPPTDLHQATIPYQDDRIEIRYSSFNSHSGLDEYHITIHPRRARTSFENQLEAIATAYAHALNCLDLPSESALLRRFFCSDPANQQALLEAHPLADIEAPCVISFVGQAPLAKGKIAMWAYHTVDRQAPLKKKRMGSTLELNRDELVHHWTTNLTSTKQPDSAAQTHCIFNDYIQFLNTKQMTLADHVVRTWLYVRDVDSNYQGLVDARRELFIKHGLTPETHYIASTGIEGRAADTAVKVSMDAYTIEGLKPEQVQFLEAPEALGPTYVYGVSFERATAIAYKDRKHVFISGTASINPAGTILHVGDVLGQLERALYNIEALLQDASSSLESVAQFTVYLRDPDDAERIQAVLDERYPQIPTILTWGPVCRPGWLIEIEAISIIACESPSLPSY